MARATYGKGTSVSRHTIGGAGIGCFEFGSKRVELLKTSCGNVRLKCSNQNGLSILIKRKKSLYI